MGGQILMVFAFVLAILGAFVMRAPPYWQRFPHFGWLAVACYFLALLLR